MLSIILFVGIAIARMDRLFEIIASLVCDHCRQLMVPYLSATTGAVGTALALNKVAKVCG